MAMIGLIVCKTMSPNLVMELTHLLHSLLRTTNKYKKKQNKTKQGNREYSARRDFSHQLEKSLYCRLICDKGYCCDSLLLTTEMNYISNFSKFE